MRKFATDALVATVVEIPAGRIRLIAADRTDATVEVLPADAGKGRDVKAAQQTRVAYADGVLRVETAPADNRLFGHTGSVEVTIQLPAGSPLHAKAASAELRGVGRLGAVTFDAAQGTVKLDEAAGAHLTLQAGDVQLGRLTGPAQVTTQQGDIRITDAVRGALELSTQAGHITVDTARTTNATLNAHTSYGRIHNALNNTDGPDAALTIHATTAHGDITARAL
jgi:DUF4097 and DUF4098 domain-containing protein YvlB